MRWIISMCILLLFAAQPALAGDFGREVTDDYDQDVMSDYGRDVIVMYVYQDKEDDLCEEDEVKTCDGGCWCCEDSNGDVVWCETCWCEDMPLEPIPTNRFSPRDR
jgi:hypothetical protein